MSHDIRLTLQDMQKAVDRMNAEVSALAAQQPKLEKALHKAISKAKAREAAAKAELPARFRPSTVTAESSDPKDLAAEFKKFRASRGEPQPVSADNAQPIGYVTIAGSAYNLLSFSYATKPDEMGRKMGADSYIFASVVTEAGDSIRTTLGQGPCTVIVQSGDLRLRGQGLQGAVVDASQPGRVALIFVGTAGTVREV